MNLDQKKGEIQLGDDRREVLNKENLNIETLLKIQRDRFGVSMPILGEFVRKFLKYQRRTLYDRLEIQDGKVTSQYR